VLHIGLTSISFQFPKYFEISGITDLFLKRS